MRRKRRTKLYQDKTNTRDTHDEKTQLRHTSLGGVIGVFAEERHSPFGTLLMAEHANGPQAQTD